MELKKCWLQKKAYIENNTLIIDKNGATELLNAKERLNRE